MASSIGIRPRARLDVVEIAAHIGRDDIFAANRFVEASEATFELLADSPHMGAAYPTTNRRLDGLRVFRVTGFPNYLIFYVERSTGIEIVRVVHGARDLEAVLRDE